MRLLVADPDVIGPKLAELLFHDEVNLDAYRAITTAATLHEAVELASEPAADLLQRLAVEDTEAEADDVIARLVEEATRRELAVMRAEVGAADEELVFERSAEMAWLKLRSEELHDPTTSAAAVDQLLAWLATRPQEMT